MTLTKDEITKLKNALKEADGFYVIESIADGLSDKEWLKKVYEKGLELAEDSSNYTEVADGICKKLEDKEWAKKVYKKAEEKAEESNDYESIAESVRDNLGDKKWAKSLEKKAKELENDD